MLPVWPQYFDSAHALIYVMDVTRTEMLAEAVVELHNILQHSNMQVTLMHVVGMLHTYAASMHVLNTCNLIVRP